MAAEAHLAALADEELAGVGEAQMVRVEPVARLDALVEPLHRVAPLVGDHAAFARAGGGARHRRAAGERDLRLVRQRPEAHAGDVDRDVELHRPPGARADDRLGVALLAVALDHETGERAGQEGEIVPVRDLLEQGETAHAVAAQLRLDVDVVDHLRREDLRRTKNVFLGFGRRAGRKPGHAGGGARGGLLAGGGGKHLLRLHRSRALDRQRLLGGGGAGGLLLACRGLLLCHVSGPHHNTSFFSPGSRLS